jgi:long-subunit acyl-CoA synthetase (AMP-forming)
MDNQPTKENWDTLVVTKENQVSWEHIEGNQYELLLHDMPSLAINLGVPPGGTLHTSDVFEEAPPKSGKWIYIGRRDQMLIHSMGLNTNPVPWESAIRPLKVVEECQLVGHNRRGPLLMVELDWSKVTDENKARETIWNAVEEYNNTIMAWSRIQHQAALVILPRGSHLERCDKETVRRGVNIKKFEMETNQGYEKWDKEAPLAKA